MADVIEINVETGEIIERQYTKKEKDQLKKDKAQNEIIATELKKEYDQQIEKRNNSIKKFIDLGFSQEDAESFVPQITPDYRIMHLL